MNHVAESHDIVIEELGMKIAEITGDIAWLADEPNSEKEIASLKRLRDLYIAERREQIELRAHFSN
ncbi:hypothetical protein [Vibrio sp. WXL210]|uniref:hypothetical protein n=1 Tax=Vibrio sp. WXL210 TaxID=3450709 RepID=UPI003EC57385